ncbi:MAG: FtsX-like permease family protein [Ruminococcus flavefaciens]|nr:FtsX-like permease family protein [Ruminococcus flavefaciens]
MNFFHMVHYAVKRILRNPRMQLLSTVIMAIVFTMIYLSLILLAGLGLGRREVQNSLAVPLENCGIVDLPNNVDFDELSRFMEEACELEEIRAFGAYSCFGNEGLVSEGDTDYGERLMEIHNAGEKEFVDRNSPDIQEVLMNRELFEMENIHLAEGNPPGAGKSDTARMYLGHNFREIPIGTVFVQDDDHSVEYVVEGIMEKGSRITDPEFLTTDQYGLTLSYDLKLDNAVLVLMPEGELYTVRNLFCADDGYTYEEAVDAMKRLGNKMGFSIKTGTVSARMDTVFADNDVIRGSINGIVSISCILLFMLCVTVQLLNVYTKRKELGVWLANGVSRRGMLGILWLENFIKAAAGIAAAGAATRFLLQELCKLFHPMEYGAALRETVPLMYGMPLFGLFGAALLLACAVSAIPVAVAGRKQTAELVKGVWN